MLLMRWLIPLVSGWLIPLNSPYCLTNPYHMIMAYTTLSLIHSNSSQVHPHWLIMAYTIITPMDPMAKSHECQ